MLGFQQFMLSTRAAAVVSWIFGSERGSYDRNRTYTARAQAWGCGPKGDEVALQRLGVVGIVSIGNIDATSSAQ